MKYQYNENAFKNQNEKCYYFLGFIFADGCLIDNGTISININKKDVEILNNFTEFLNTSKPIFQVEKTNSVLFSFRNKKIYNQLLDFGLTPRKSLTLKFPKNVPDNLMNHFIRGYFDGDGCVSLINKKTTRGMKINIVSTLEFLTELQKILIKEIKINKTKLCQITKGKNTYQLNIKAKDDVLKFKNYLYINSNIFLTRKKYIFDQEVGYKIQNSTSSKYRNIRLRNKNWLVTYYDDNKKRREKSGFKTENEAYQFLININGK